MMFSIKSAIMTALQSATALSTITGFHFFFPPDFINLPALSYFELDNTGNLYADNQEIGSEIVVQVDLWSKNSLTDLAKGVDSAMASIDFDRISSIDLYEDDTKIHHKAMRFRRDYADPDF